MIRAAEQAGVLTREQVIAHGLGEASLQRLRDSGRWQQITRRIYFTETSDPPWLALAWTGVRLGGDRARLALDAASHLHGIRAIEPDVIAVQSVREQWMDSPCEYTRQIHPIRLVLDDRGRDAGQGGPARGGSEAEADRWLDRGQPAERLIAPDTLDAD
jgi:hypothetical protein